MGRKFKAPRRDDDEQWRKVELLVDHGFLFERAYDRPEIARYPRTLAEAREFVRRTGRKAIAATEPQPARGWRRDSSQLMCDRMLRPAKRKRQRR